MERPPNYIANVLQQGCRSEFRQLIEQFDCLVSLTLVNGSGVPPVSRALTFGFDGHGSTVVWVELSISIHQHPDFSTPSGDDFAVNGVLGFIHRISPS
jgi:hypothetical protein